MSYSLVVWFSSAYLHPCQCPTIWVLSFLFFSILIVLNNSLCPISEPGKVKQTKVKKLCRVVGWAQNSEFPSAVLDRLPPSVLGTESKTRPMPTLVPVFPGPVGAGFQGCGGAFRLALSGSHRGLFFKKPFLPRELKSPPLALEEPEGEVWAPSAPTPLPAPLVHPTPISRVFRWKNWWQG